MSIVNNYLIGIDLGTTNVKAIIMGEDGAVIASAARANSLIIPGSNMAEQDANQWWSNTKEILQEITSRAGKEIVSKIRGISISSQTVTMLPVDKKGTPLRNALIWMDSRSHDELHHIVDTIGFNRYVEIIGGQPDVAFLPNKILWFKNNEPELFKKTSCILQASSYLNYKLTGEMTMDIDQASKSQCLDISTLKWSEEISNIIGVNLSDLLPSPQPVDKIIGFVTEEAAMETGLAASIPVVAGASDAMASMYATGLSKLGEAGESAGTSSLVFVGSDKPSAPDGSLVTKTCSISGMPYIFDAPISASGACLKWYLDTLGKAELDYAEEHNMNVYDYMNQLAAESAAGSNGVIFFPYLHGERAPLWNTHARGMFIGMSLDTQHKDILRSVFEGTAFALRHVISTINEAGASTNCLRITGGGSNSRLWCQIKASMLRMPVYILDEKSGDVPFGDTLIAGTAVGVFTNLTETINKLIHVKEVVEPVEEWAQVYDKLYPLYIDMYKHLDKDLMKLKQNVEEIATL